MEQLLNPLARYTDAMLRWAEAIEAGDPIEAMKWEQEVENALTIVKG